MSQPLTPDLEAADFGHFATYMSSDTQATLSEWSLDLLLALYALQWKSELEDCATKWDCLRLFEYDRQSLLGLSSITDGDTMRARLTSLLAEADLVEGSLEKFTIQFDLRRPSTIIHLTDDDIEEDLEGDASQHTLNLTAVPTPVSPLKSIADFHCELIHPDSD